MPGRGKVTRPDPPAAGPRSEIPVPVPDLIPSLVSFISFTEIDHLSILLVEKNNIGVMLVVSCMEIDHWSIFKIRNEHFITSWAHLLIENRSLINFQNKE